MVKGGEELMGLAGMLDGITASARGHVTGGIVTQTQRRIPKDTGRAEGSILAFAGGGVPQTPPAGAPPMDPATAAQIGEGTGLGQGGVAVTAPYSRILDDGRRYSSTLGRMIGSNQAPDGFQAQALEAVTLDDWDPDQ